MSEPIDLDKLQRVYDQDWVYTGSPATVLAKAFPSLSLELRQLRRKVEIYKKAFADFESATAAVPVGAEDRGAGESVYNWRKKYSREMEARISAMAAAGEADNE